LVAQRRLLAVDVEGPLRLARGHQVERLLLEDADRAGVAVGAGLGGAAEAIDLAQQLPAGVEAGRPPRPRRGAGRGGGGGGAGGVRVGALGSASMTNGAAAAPR